MSSPVRSSIAERAAPPPPASRYQNWKFQLDLVLDERGRGPRRNGPLPEVAADAGHRALDEGATVDAVAHHSLHHRRAQVRNQRRLDPAWVRLVLGVAESRRDEVARESEPLGGLHGAGRGHRVDPPAPASAVRLVPALDHARRPARRRSARDGRSSPREGPWEEPLEAPWRVPGEPAEMKVCSGVPRNVIATLGPLVGSLRRTPIAPCPGASGSPPGRSNPRPSLRIQPD